MFVKDKDKEPDTLYIVIKQMVGPNSFNVATVPYNILIMSEQNQLEMAKQIANTFAVNYNFAVSYGDDYCIKHSYQQPSILSNFNQIDVGVRSIIYIPTVLTVITNTRFLTSDGVSDYGAISIDEESIRPLSVSVNYSMSPDTQQFPGEEIAISRKDSATLALTLVVPLYSDKNFVAKVLNIMSEDSEVNGDTSFEVEFSIGNIEFDVSMKCISAQFEDTPDSSPILRIGLMK